MASRCIKKLILLLPLLILIIIFKYFEKKDKAIHLAKNYLNQKYTQEMRYLRCRHSFIDPALYHVYFSPKEKLGVVFKVIVGNDLTLKAGRTNSYGDHYEPDNYLLRLFEFEAESFIQEKLDNICINGINRIIISTQNSAIYSFETPIEINEKMNFKEMEPFIKYDISIMINGLIGIEDVSCILDIIKMIKEFEFKPNCIKFYDKTSFFTERFEIENLCEIETTENILDIVERGHAQSP